LNFLAEFISDWRTVGAVAPTSRFTRRAMLAPVDWARARIVVELGAGTGNISRGILERLHPDARFLAIEINDRFVERLRASLSDPRVEVVHGSATDLPAMLEQRGLAGADAIISAIPFTSLGPELRHGILDAAVQGLGPGGRFVAIQYMPFVLPPLLQKHFGGYEVGRSWLNIPPALIYTCTRASSGDV
jgi:phospholipid N-methyltransferase